jgi:hypothetical protein
MRTSASKSSFAWKGAQYSPRFGRVNTSLAAHAQPLNSRVNALRAPGKGAFLVRK